MSRIYQFKSLIWSLWKVNFGSCWNVTRTNYEKLDQQFPPKAIVVGAKSSNLTPQDPKILKLQYIVNIIQHMFWVMQVRQNTKLLEFNVDGYKML